MEFMDGVPLDRLLRRSARKFGLIAESFANETSDRYEIG